MALQRSTARVNDDARSSIDHVGIATFDLDALRALWCAAGFTVTTPKSLRALDASGASQSLRQRSCHAVFGHTYLELTEVERDALDHHLAPWLHTGAGLHILAFGDARLEHRHAAVALAGLMPSAIAHATRFVDYGTRHGDAQFDWFMLPPVATPEGLVCMVRNTTRELVFQPEVQHHGNGMLDIREVIVSAVDWQRTCARYTALLGLSPVVPRGEEAQFRLPGAILTVMSTSALRARYPLAIGDPPCDALAVLRIATSARARELRLMRFAGSGPLLILEPA